MKKLLLLLISTSALWASQEKKKENEATLPLQSFTVTQAITPQEAKLVTEALALKKAKKVHFRDEAKVISIEALDANPRERKKRRTAREEQVEIATSEVNLEELQEDAKNLLNDSFIKFIKAEDLIVLRQEMIDKIFNAITELDIKGAPVKEFNSDYYALLYDGMVTFLENDMIEESLRNSGELLEYLIDPIGNAPSSNLYSNN